MSRLSLDLVGIVVSDMARSLAFYRQLGMEFPDGAEKEDHVEATLPNGLRLALDLEALIRNIDPGWTAPQGSPRVVLAFRCATPADVNETYENLTTAGHHGHRAPWDAFWGQRYAQVQDPDGNSIDLFADLPRS